MDVMRGKSPIWREKGVELHCKRIVIALLFYCFFIAFAVLVFSIKPLKYMKNVKNAFGREKNFPTIVFHFVSRIVHTAWLWTAGCDPLDGPASGSTRRRRAQVIERKGEIDEVRKNFPLPLANPPAEYYVRSMFGKRSSPWRPWERRRLAGMARSAPGRLERTPKRWRRARLDRRDAAWTAWPVYA